MIPVTQNHVTYQGEAKLKDIAKPLNKLAGIHYLCYGVNFPDTSGFTLTTDTRYYENVFKYEIPFCGFFLNNGWHYQDAFTSQVEIQFAQELGIGHCMYYIKRQINKTEIFAFGTTPDNKKIFEFYFNNQHLLKRFTNHYTREAKELIIEASNQLVTPPSCMTKIDAMTEHNNNQYQLLIKDFLEVLLDPLSQLSAREIECYHYLLQGYSKQKLAKNMRSLHKLSMFILIASKINSNVEIK